MGETYPTETTETYPTETTVTVPTEPTTTSTHSTTPYIHTPYSSYPTTTMFTEPPTEPTTTTTHSTTPYTTTPPHSTTQATESTYCPYGPMECREIRNRYAIKNAPGTPVIALVADSSKDLEEEEDVIVKGDSSPEILHPVRIGPHYKRSLNNRLARILPTSTSRTAYAMVFKSTKKGREIRQMFTQGHIVGRVWSRIFPEQDTYVFRTNGMRMVVTILRRVMPGRQYFAVDFYYSHYYIVGKPT